MNENTTKNSNSLYQKTLLQEYEESLNGVDCTLPTNAEEILNTLLKDEEFNADLDALLASLTEKDEFDLVTVQSKFILMLRGALKRLEKAKKLDKEHNKTNERDVAEELVLISHHLLMRGSTKSQEYMEGLDAPRDRKSHLRSSSRAYTKQMLKKFAIYEAYKWMNPRRIAGETKRDNFVHNMITGGIKKAMQYEGGTKEELKSYSPSFIKKLEKQHEKFSKSGGRLI